MSKQNDVLLADDQWREWNHFWFGDIRSAKVLRSVRIGMAFLSVWYFASHWNDIGMWFADGGLLDAKALARFLSDAELGDTVRWRISPLFLMSSTFVLRTYLLIGMSLAVVSVFDFGPNRPLSRLVPIMLWLSVVWLANRSLLLSGLEEIVLVFGLGYLAIAPATAQWSWTTSLWRRLTQVHVSLLLLVTGLSMLSSTAWWNGTGVIALIAPVEMRFFDLVDLLSSAPLYEALTHCIVGIALVAPILLWHPRTRPFAMGIAISWCAALALLSSQLLYFATIGVLLTSFRQPKP